MGNGSGNKKITASVLLLAVLCLLLMLGDREQQKKAETPEKENLKNVMVLAMDEKSITVLSGGESRTFLWTEAPAVKIPALIADLTVYENRVLSMVGKTDTVEAKVLRIGEEEIELEGYGTLKLEEGSRVYEVYDTVREAGWSDVVVGYTTSEFVVQGNTVCAALIREKVVATDIRVLIQSSSYGGYYHDTLRCKSVGRFYISDGSERTVWYDGGTEMVITKEVVETYGGRIYIGTEEKDGKLQLLNVKRAVGIPEYRGVLEVSVSEEKLLVVNELSLEEYLYGVLPSEMPDSFGTEALKAQAVCARSYACNQLLANRFRAYGAHVDDSMECQVYQNYGETEAAIRAVKETFGRVLQQDGKCITAYYFSCSYGHTSSGEDVWGNAEATAPVGVVQRAGVEKISYDLSKEGEFQSFFYEEAEWYDEESAWFRWETVLASEMNEVLLERLKERKKAAPDCILLLTGKKGSELSFSDGKVEKFGVLTNITVLERSSSGLVTRLLLEGSEASYLIQKEYNIRYVLAPVSVIYLQNQNVTSNMTLLPSAYFFIRSQQNCFLLCGGGYGHGVGMSQYGAKYLAAKGKGYEEILKHYYRNASLGYLY